MKKKGERDALSMAASYKNTYTINAGIQQLRNTIRSRAFAGRLNIEMKSENPTPMGVWYRFHHGVTFASWGEKITITLTPLPDSTTQVEIHSECPTQVVDWGKNKQVVCNVYEYLEANAPNMPITSSQPTAQTPSRFCTSCGSPVDSTSNFCSRCGAKLR